MCTRCRGATSLSATAFPNRPQQSLGVGSKRLYASPAVDLKGVTLLGKYEVEKQLGEGGMGAVWLGRHKLLGRQVAIKVLDDRFLNHPEVVERFGREARAASAIQHPGIVEVLDIDKTEEGIPFLVMELLNGEPLSSRIERVGRMAEKDAVEVITQLLEALDAAHDAGIVHRDLKPDNVFLVPRGRGGENVKILDFGISHKSDEQGMKLTMEGSVLGTPHYMSPEQAMGKKDIDLRADIYAAGVLFYECLTGDVPFDAENYNALILKILSEEPRSPAHLGVKLDPVIEGALMSSIAKDRDLRPASCQQMLEMLRGERPPMVALKGSKSGDDVSDLEFPSGGTVPMGSAAPPPKERGPRKRSTAVQDIFRNSARGSSPGQEGERLSLDINIGRGKPASEDQDLDLGASLDPDLDPPDMSSPPPAPAAAAISSPRPAAPQVAQPEVPKQSGWGAKALLIGLVVIGIMLAVIAVIKITDDGGSEVTTTQTQTNATAGVGVPTPSKMVEVTLRGLPAAAKVKLNGFPVATFPMRVRRGEEQEVKIVADGYVEETLTFVANEDKVLPVRLQREEQVFQKLDVPGGSESDDETEEVPDDGTPDESGASPDDKPSN